MTDAKEPTIVQVVGTEEFEEAWEEVRQSLNRVWESGANARLRELERTIKKACRLAYEAGFDEGVCK
jgi:hypothetical protein